MESKDTIGNNTRENFKEIEKMWPQVQCSIISEVMEIIKEQSRLNSLSEQPQENSKENCPRIVACGKTGTGKSSLLNAFMLGYVDEDTIECFKTSASIDACTYKTVSQKGKLLGTEGMIQGIDTPGLHEGEMSDSKHIIDMIQHLKSEQKYVNLFMFTVNGQEPRFDNGTRLLIKTFEQSFGDGFWNHLAVVYTRWGSSPQDKQRRKRAKLTEEARTDEIIAMLNNEYPASKGKTIGVYFTDTFEIDEEKLDPTSQVLRTIWTVAAAKDKFFCSDILAVKCLKWKEEYENTLKKILSIQTQISEEDNFRERFQKTFEFLINMDVEIQKQLSSDQYKKCNDLVLKIFAILTEEQKQEAQRKQKIAEEKHKEKLEAQRLEAERVKKENEKRHQEEIQRQKLKAQQKERELQEIAAKEKREREEAERQKQRAQERQRELEREVSRERRRRPSPQSFGGFGGGMGGMSMSSFSSSRHNGPRCNDGTLDMRFSANRGHNKYS